MVARDRCRLPIACLPRLAVEAETFNYTAQNTGKYQYHNTTMTNAWYVRRINKLWFDYHHHNRHFFPQLCHISHLGRVQPPPIWSCRFRHGWFKTQSLILVLVLMLQPTLRPYRWRIFQCNPAGLVGVAKF